MKKNNAEKTAAIQPEKQEAPKALLPRKDKKIEMQLRCDFTEKELLGYGRKMAEATRDLATKEEEKKAVTSQLKSVCDGIAARQSEYSGKLMAGYEYRTIPCVVKYDTPTTGQKTIIRLDTNDVVAVEQMSLGEMQVELDLKGEPKPENHEGRKANADETGCVTVGADGNDAVHGSDY